MRRGSNALFEPAGLVTAPGGGILKMLGPDCGVSDIETMYHSGMCSYTSTYEYISISTCRWEVNHLQGSLGARCFTPIAMGAPRLNAKQMVTLEAPLWIN